MYSLSNCILLINRFFNKNVFPPSLGPDVTHQKLSMNEAFTIISSSSSRDCRLSLTLTCKAGPPLVGETRLALPQSGALIREPVLPIDVLLV